MHTIDLQSCHARAVRATVPVVARITPPDFSRPTPCAQWDLGQLLAHMTEQHLIFAVAAAGQPLSDPPLDADPIRAYTAAAETAIAAFAAPGVLDRDLALPELTSQPVPGRMVIGFHLVDYVVHGWDVAHSLGLPYELPADVLATALPIAAAVPQEGRLEPGAAFGPRVPDPGGDQLERILALLGRDPAQDVVPRG